MNDRSPDIESASADYASRFAGRAGEYMLSTQSDCVASVLKDYEGGTLLDVGGGHGQLVGLYESLGINYTVQGSDEACFDFALSELKPERKIVSDLRQIPQKDTSVDVVIAVRLITHLDDWQVVLREMCRVARKAVVIDYPPRRSLNVLAPLLFTVKKNIEGNTRTFSNFSRSDFQETFEDAGFHTDMSVNQFFFPMVIHRLLKGRAVSRIIEKLSRMLGLTWALGSPTILRAVRDDGPMAESARPGGAVAREF